MVVYKSQHKDSPLSRPSSTISNRWFWTTCIRSKTRLSRCFSRKQKALKKSVCFLPGACQMLLSAIWRTTQICANSRSARISKFLIRFFQSKKKSNYQIKNFVGVSDFARNCRQSRSETALKSAMISSALLEAFDLYAMSICRAVRASPMLEFDIWLMARADHIWRIWIWAR